jgi:hypothetical protein
MQKRAQLAIFVIIAIILVLLIGFFVFQNYQKKVRVEAEVKNIKEYLKNCIEMKINEGILTISKQGGYYMLPENKAEILEEKSVYYLKNNSTLIPKKEEVENQLAYFLEENINPCYKELKKEKCDIFVSLTNYSYFLFDCKFIYKKDKAYELDGFEKKLEIDLTKFIEMSKEIVENYKNGERGFICIECLEEIAKKYDINITIVPIENDVWILLKSSNKIENKNLTWRFVMEI